MTMPEQKTITETYWVCHPTDWPLDKQSTTVRHYATPTEAQREAAYFNAHLEPDEKPWSAVQVEVSYLLTRLDAPGSPTSDETGPQDE